MKKYRILVGIIMALSIIIIGTSEPAKNLYKASNLISKGIKVDDKKGSLEIGKDADIAIFNENMDCLATIVEGDTIYNKIN